MADITNPEAIAFCNTEVRPIAEELRNLKIRVDAAITKWNSGINTIVGSSADDAIIDGRADQGVSVLTGEDVSNLGAQMIAFQAQMDAAGVAEVISKPCVRAVSIS